MRLATLADHEAFVTTVSVLTAGVTWFFWYLPLPRGPRLRRPAGPRLLAALGLPFALALVYGILQLWSASDVRDSSEYLFLYTVLGAAWIGFASRTWSWLGLSLRDDVVERGNLAAAVALCGLLAGVGLCYAGGNIGDGPGWWVVVFAGALATACWYAGWIVLEKKLHVSEVLTIDRDLAAGLRLGAYAAASGLLLGRGVAGDWVSVDDTLMDLVRDGWPALVLLALAYALERALRPTREAPRRALFACGVLPATLYLVLSLLWVAWRGEWQ